MIFSLSWEDYFDAINEATRKVWFEFGEGIGTVYIEPMSNEVRVEYQDDDWSLNFEMCSPYTLDEVIEKVEMELKELRGDVDGEEAE